jgi:hypothetical protein
VPAFNTNPLVSIGFVAAAMKLPIVKICRGFVAAWTWVEFQQRGFGVMSGKLLLSLIIWCCYEDNSFVLYCNILKPRVMRISKEDC